MLLYKLNSIRCQHFITSRVKYFLSDRPLIFQMNGVGFGIVDSHQRDYAHEVDQLHRDVIVSSVSLELLERIIGTAA